MNKIAKNNIIADLYEYEDDERINNLFLHILPPNQKSSYLTFFLKSDEIEKRHVYSRKLFTFLLSLEKCFKNKNHSFNYTKHLDKFLLEIQNSEYLKSNIHFISRSVQRILEYVFTRREFGTFCLISYEAKLLKLEDIPSLPLFFNQDQDIDVILKDKLSNFIPFMSNSDEKLLIWCYCENLHSDFCKIIDYQKKYILDDFGLSIIKQRIKISQESFHHYPAHFITFLSMLYPSINQVLENNYILKNPISSDRRKDITSLTLQNNYESFDNSDIDLRFLNVRHFFKISELQIKDDSRDVSPQSLPATRKKLLSFQARPKIEFKMIPSIVDRFKNTHISFQGKNQANNLSMPSNFIHSDFKSALNSFSKAVKNDDDEIQFKNNDVLSYHCKKTNYNRTTSRTTISLHLNSPSNDNKNEPNDNKKVQTGPNSASKATINKKKLLNNCLNNDNPILEQSHDSLPISNDQNRNYQSYSSKKINDFNNSKQIKTSKQEKVTNDESNSNYKENKFSEDYSRASNHGKIGIPVSRYSNKKICLTLNSDSKNKSTQKRPQQIQGQNSPQIIIQKRDNLSNNIVLSKK